MLMEICLKNRAKKYNVKISNNPLILNLFLKDNLLSINQKMNQKPN